MATNLSNFDSLGGFSVGETTHIDEGHNAMSLNTIEMKNLFYGDSKTTNYILRGLNTSTLQLDNVGTQITIESNTVNFITGHFLGVNPSGVIFTGKLRAQFIVALLEQLKFYQVCLLSLKMIFQMQNHGL